MRLPPTRKSKGKPGQQELLPSRHAMSQLVGGDPSQRSINNYSKLTPSGLAGMGQSYSAITALGQKSDDV